MNPEEMQADSRIYVAGHRGMAGSAICRKLEEAGYRRLIVRASDQLDLRDGTAVRRFFAGEQPEYVFLAAALVGGILANSTRPAEFLHDNLAIGINVIDAAYRSGVKKLLFLGSSCIYPKFAPQPIAEEALLTGALEPTNEWYAVAKIAGIKMAQAYRRQYGFHAISLMPPNLYGPGDNFDLQSSHVVPALIRKFHEAKERAASRRWRSGDPVRRDGNSCTSTIWPTAAVFLMAHYDDERILNVGAGEDVTIRELAETIAEIAGYSGDLVFDPAKPDGTPRKVLDVSRLQALGWRPRIALKDGLAATYDWYRAHAGDYT